MSNNPNFIRYSELLSYKLGYPVSGGNEDAGRYTAELRANYLNRAYNKLRRLLESISFDLVQQIYPDFYHISYSNKISNGNIPLTGIGFDIYHVYIYYSSKYPDPPSLQDFSDAVGSDKHYEANRLKPENYFKVKYNSSSDYYKPSKEDARFFYSIINNKIEFLPSDLTDYYADLLLKRDNQEFSYNEGDSDDIRIPKDYLDIFLTIAVEEAMYDDGSNIAIQKARTYAAEINRQISILMGKEQKDEREGDKRTVDE